MMSTRSHGHTWTGISLRIIPNIVGLFGCIINYISYKTMAINSIETGHCCIIQSQDGFTYTNEEGDKIIVNYIENSKIPMH